MQAIINIQNNMFLEKSAGVSVLERLLKILETKNVIRVFLISDKINVVEELIQNKNFFLDYSIHNSADEVLTKSFMSSYIISSPVICENAYLDINDINTPFMLGNTDNYYVPYSELQNMKAIGDLKLKNYKIINNDSFYINLLTKNDINNAEQYLYKTLLSNDNNLAERILKAPADIITRFFIFFNPKILAAIGFLIGLCSIIPLCFIKGNFREAISGFIYYFSIILSTAAFNTAQIKNKLTEKYLGLNFIFNEIRNIIFIIILSVYSYFYLNPDKIISIIFMILIPVFFITGRLINLVINTKNNNTEWENYKKRISCTNKNSFFNLMKPITSNLFYGLVLVILGLLNLYKYSFFAILPFAIIIFLVYIMKLIVYTNNHHKLIKQYKNIKACLFDFDGTLVDDMMEFADLAGLTMNKFYNTGFEIARKRYIDITGIPFIQQIHAIYPGALKNDEANFFFETNKEELFFNEHIEEDVKETLIWLKNKGYKIAVSSGGFRDMMVEFCKRDNVDFDFILGYEKGFEKGPEHFSYLLKEFNIGKDELLFMGDSLKDGEKGINFGIKFIAKIGTFSKKAFKEKFNNILTVNRISELKKILHSSK